MSQRALSTEFVAGLRKNYSSKPQQLLQSALATTGVNEAAVNREVLNSRDHTHFSVKLDTWTATNQKASGRCWLFAALNVMRGRLMTDLKMTDKSFEFSQSYLFFWDKFERANYFLEAIIETAERDVDDRTVAHLLDLPCDDGGQWNMIVGLVAKYGVAPKHSMPETYSSGASRWLNGDIRRRLRAGAKRLRDVYAEHKDSETLSSALIKEKQTILDGIYTMLCMHLGTPPETVEFSYHAKPETKKEEKAVEAAEEVVVQDVKEEKKDTKSVYTRHADITPLELYRKFPEQLNIDQFVCVVHDPRNPTMKTYTVEFLGNVVGGPPVVYLNLPVERLKQLAMQQLRGTDGKGENGTPVWFGCDVGQQFHRSKGMWAKNLYDFDRFYGTNFDLDKSGRLTYHQSLMTHAMVFTGVDVVDDKSHAWRVENSWSADRGKKGFYLMVDDWFDEYVFEIACPRDLLTDEERAALDLEPHKLPPWDPMGSLARSEGGPMFEEE